MFILSVILSSGKLEMLKRRGESYGGIEEYYYTLII